MKQFTLDLGQLTVADLSTGAPVSDGPRRALPSSERDIIRKALDFGKSFDSDLGSLEEVADISQGSTSVTVRPSPIVPIIGRGGKSDVTLSIGLTGFAAFVGGVSLQGGFYGSTTGEFGVFGTGGFMLGIVSGAGAGLHLGGAK
jgi:hypothetical protein